MGPQGFLAITPERWLGFGFGWLLARLASAWLALAWLGFRLALLRISGGFGSISVGFWLGPDLA